MISLAGLGAGSLDNAACGSLFLTYTAVAAASAQRNFESISIIMDLIMVMIVRLNRSATPFDSWEYGGAYSIAIEGMENFLIDLCG